MPGPQIKPRVSGLLHPLHKIHKKLRIIIIRIHLVFQNSRIQEDISKKATFIAITFDTAIIPT